MKTPNVHLRGSTDLRNARVFGGLPRTLFRQLEQTGGRYSLQSGQVMDSGGFERPIVLVPVRGRVRLYLLAPTGREFTLEDLEPGRLFCASKVSSDPVQLMLEALEEPTTMYTFERDSLIHELQAYPVGLSEFTSILLEDALALQKLVGELVFCDVRTRLVHKLAELARNDTERTVRLTHQQLALSIGTRQNKATEILHSLRKSGIVHFADHQQRRIVVPDIDKLTAAASSP